MVDYDTPREKLCSETSSCLFTMQKSSTCSHLLYDFPSKQLSQSKIYRNERPLEMTVALKQLSCLQTEVKDAIQNVVKFVQHSWRQSNQLEPILNELKNAAAKLNTLTYKLYEFAKTVYENENMSNLEDVALFSQHQFLLKKLKEHYHSFNENFLSLNSLDWKLSELSRESSNQHEEPDSLDYLVLCSQNLIEDLRHYVSFIQGNASLLFESDTSASSTNQIKNTKFIDNEPQYSGSKLNRTDTIIINDKFNLVQQIIFQVNYLNETIETFLKELEHNQPPKIFISNLKIILFTAHPILSVGFILYDKFSEDYFKTQLLSLIDNLAVSLKLCVSKTKHACQCFPSVVAIQDMVDSILYLSRSALDLKILIVKNIAV